MPKHVMILLMSLALCQGCGHDQSGAAARAPEISGPPDSTSMPGWTDPVRGLQFKVDLKTLLHKPNAIIPISISVKNASDSDIAVLDPSKLPVAERSIVYYAQLFSNDMAKDHTFSFKYSLVPVYKAAWYTVLSPGETISGDLVVRHDAPTGEYKLVVSPYMIKPRDNMEREMWKKTDLQRIEPIAWTNWEECRAAKKRVPELGPFAVKIGDNKPNAGDGK